MRVYELAKQMGITSNELIGKLKDIGIEVKSHSSSINPEVAKQIDAAQTASSTPLKKSAATGSQKRDSKSGVKTVKAKPADKAQTEQASKKPKHSTQTKKEKPLTKDTAKNTTAAKQVIKTPDKAKNHKVEISAFKPEMQKTKKTSVKDRGPEVEKEVLQQKSKSIDVPQAATVKELAPLVGKEPNELIKMLLKLGELVTISQSLSSEAIEVIADDLGFEANIVNPEEIHEEVEIEDSESDLESRPPVVTVMGHVDHGKTSLLDAIRKTDVTAGEAGGITQHIGAYQVEHNDKKITFVDTPGHEAFTAMRARGANVTDIVVLVVAADDGVMPQTVEAINHAKAADVPIIVAVNKIDKPGADPTKVRQELTRYDLVPEDWGGNIIFVDVSAKKQTNLEELLEMILLVAEVQELKANPHVQGKGICIESKLDKGRGPVATVLINRGNLNVGDAVVAGTAFGKIRMLSDDKSQLVRRVTPAQPVEVMGLSSLPHAGEELRVVEDERSARHIAEERALKRRLIEQEKRHRITLEDVFNRIQHGEVRELKLVIKADTHGSVEALKDALQKLNTEEVKIQVIHTGVGGISETDIMLAAASNAIVIGYNVRPDINATTLATKESVDIRTYRVIYKAVEDITGALSGLLSPAIDEVDTGQAEVRATFKVPKLGIIAGCYVLNGEIDRNDRIRLVREGQIVYDGGIISLRRFKDDVKTVREGFECGIGIENYQDIKEGDILEAYRIVERERQLGE